MLNNKSDLELLKAILRANLNKSELQVVHLLMKKKDKTITTPISELAKELGMAQPNFTRAIKSLKAANVVGSRGEGIFVRSKISWGKKSA